MNAAVDPKLERHFRRIMVTIGRGRIKLVDDSGEVQMAQVDLGPVGPGGSLGLRDKTPVCSSYGLMAYPPADSHAIVVFSGGDRTSGVAVATNHQASRPTGLSEGDAGIYNRSGMRVWLKDGVEIVIEAATHPVRVINASTVTVVSAGTVRVEAPRLECTGDIIDHCDSQTATLKGLRDAYDAHLHTGVQTGAGVTGLTDHIV